MSPVAPAPVHDSSRPTSVGAPLRRVAAVGCILILAHLPLLAVQTRQLWMRPHYQFLPFVLAGAAFLTFVRVRDLGPLQPGSKVLSSLLLAISWCLLALASLLFSPWLGTVAALATLAALAFALGGMALLRPLLPVWLFLWLIVPPPFGLDQGLISGLQTLTARCSSRVLDLLGVFHVLAGHVVEIGDRRFLVEEACSGTHSFFAVLPVALFFLLWTRRSALQAALLVAGALVWIILANVGRVVGITALGTQWGIDLAGGWRHEAFGWLVFLLTLGLIMSTDRLILFLTSPALPAQAKVISALVPHPQASQALDGGRPTQWPDLRQTVLTGRPVPVAFGVLALAQLGFFWAWFFQPSMSINGLDTLRADTLPARCGPWERTGYDHGWVGHYGAFFSQTWTYHSEKRPAVVSLDYPFQGWHELTGCYTRTGWTVQGNSTHPPGDGEAGPFLAEVMFSKSLDQHAYLLYSLFDGRGQPVEPAAGAQEGWLQPFARRLPGGQGTPSCQVQLLVQSSAPLTPDEQQQARNFFHQVWSILRSHCSSGQESSP